MWTPGSIERSIDLKSYVTPIIEAKWLTDVRYEIEFWKINRRRSSHTHRSVSLVVHGANQVNTAVPRRVNLRAEPARGRKQ